MGNCFCGICFDFRLYIHIHIFRFIFFTASSWGCDGTNCCKGCGSQEQFYGCSDVAIFTSGSQYSISRPIASSGISGTSLSVFGIGAPQSGSVQVDQLSAIQNIAHSGQPVVSSSVIGIGAPQGGPSQLGAFPGQQLKCQATQFARSKYTYADQWCQTQCKIGNCPGTYCEAACRSLFG